jgi:hypothetical protein
MLGVIFVVGIVSGGDTAKSTYISLVITGAWLLVSVTYFIVSSKRRGIAIIPAASAGK